MSRVKWLKVGDRVRLISDVEDFNDSTGEWYTAGKKGDTGVITDVELTDMPKAKMDNGDVLILEVISDEAMEFEIIQ